MAHHNAAPGGNWGQYNGRQNGPSANARPYPGSNQQQHPPQYPYPRPEQQQGTPSYPPRQQHPQPSRTPSYSDPQQPPHASVEHEIPACPMSFPQIQAMSVQELRNYIDNPDAFDKFISEHPHRVQIEDVLTKRRRQVAEMQMRNSSQEADLSRMSAGTTGKSLEEQLVEEKAKLEESRRKFDDWLSRNSHDQLEKRLADSANEARLASEDLTERFKSGDLGYDQYIEEFSEARRLYHERSIKLARFRKLKPSSG